MKNRPSVSLPREHGFWVMAVAASAAGLSRTYGDGLAWLATSAAALVAVFFGSLFHKRIRRSSPGQLVSSALLALLLVPAELVAGIDGQVLVFDLAAWAAIFVGCSLTVRAAFARARRRSPRLYSLASVIVPGGVGATLFAMRRPDAGVACTVAAAGCLALSVWAPGPKQLKGVGLSLAAIVTASLVGFTVL